MNIDKKKQYHKEYHKKWYEQNKEKRRIQLSARKQRTKQEATLFINNYKLQHGCLDCGYNKAAIALDFDHLKDKSHNISKMVADGLSIDTIMVEAAKCEIVCANCHRIRTHDRRSEPGSIIGVWTPKK